MIGIGQAARDGDGGAGVGGRPLIGAHREHLPMNQLSRPEQETVMNGVGPPVIWIQNDAARGGDKGLVR